MNRFMNGSGSFILSGLHSALSDFHDNLIF